jgi:hypothetical protein
LYEGPSPGLADELYKFAFVRNPWSYVASYYNYTKRHRRLPNPTLSFKEWVLTDAPRSNLEHNYCPHTVPLATTPQLQFLSVNGEVKMDFIGRYETLQSDLDRVMDHLNLDRVKLSMLNAGPSYDYRDMYDNELHDYIEKCFAWDIEYFGYTF